MKYEVQNFLPHRAPFLMVDYLSGIDHDSVTSVFTITGDNLFVENGHFNEAGLIENIAQTCSTVTGQSIFTTAEEKQEKKAIGFITSIKKVSTFQLPKVGATITTKARLVSQYDKICNLSCEIFCGEELMMSADISMFIQEITS